MGKHCIVRSGENRVRSVQVEHLFYLFWETAHINLEQKCLTFWMKMIDLCDICRNLFVHLEVDENTMNLLTL